jgi:hypothetical protein
VDGRDTHLFGVSKTNWIVIYVVIIATGIGTISFMRLPRHTANISEANDHFKQARTTIDPEKLRAWAFQELAKYPATNETDIPGPELPDYVKALTTHPPTGAYVVRANGRECVVFDWSNPNFDWTIMVGRTNLAMRSSTQINVEPWVPGIYFTRVDR